MGYPIMNLIHIVIDRFVHALDSIRDIDLAIEQLRLIDAGHFLNLFYQRSSFLISYKFRGLDTGYEELQLRHLKKPAADILIAGLLDNIHAICPKHFDVGIDAFSFSRDIVLVKVGNDLLHCHGMLLISIFQQIIPQIEQL
jgi:hypothetical protein